MKKEKNRAIEKETLREQKKYNMISIVALIVSMISLSISIVNSKKDIEMRKSENSPHFTVSYIDHDEEYDSNRMTHKAGTEYIIKNISGSAVNPKLNCMSTLTICLKDDEDNNIDIECIVIGVHEKERNIFDIENDCFYLNMCSDEREQELWTYLNEKLKEKFDNYEQLYFTNYVNISYFDIYEEIHNEWYMLFKERLIICEKGLTISPETILYINDMSNEEIYNAVVEKINSTIAF